MAEQEETDEEEPAPVIPYRSSIPDASPVIPYSSGLPKDRLVIIRKMKSMEAHLAKTKLESEGIECFILDENIAANHPWVFPEVKLQVAEADAKRAEEILLAPADADAEGEYADEAWRCPKCHHKKVDLIPVSGSMRSAQVGCLTILLLPLILAIIEITLLTPQMTKWLDRSTDAWRIPWLLIVCAFTFFILTRKRRKRCEDCGHVWTHGETEQES